MNATRLLTGGQPLLDSRDKRRDLNINHQTTKIIEKNLK